MKRAILIATWLVASACLDHELPEGDEGRSALQFIALQRDFSPLMAWPTLDAGATPLEGHPEGARVLHVSRMPQIGATEFPVGTIIAKSVQSGPMTSWLLHAMVKRGNDFNARGAFGWEWFELRLTEDGVPVIVWRGQTPPNGERYGCLQGTCEDAPDCNQCHQQAARDDFVMSEALRLNL